MQSKQISHETVHQPKTKLVVFTKNSVRVFVNPPLELVERSLKSGHALLNPSLDNVKSTPLHYWKVEEGLIKPMTPIEMEFRDRDISKNGIKTKVDFYDPPAPIKISFFSILALKITKIYERLTKCLRYIFH